MDVDDDTCSSDGTSEENNEEHLAFDLEYVGKSLNDFSQTIFSTLNDAIISTTNTTNEVFATTLDSTNGVFSSTFDTIVKMPSSFVQLPITIGSLAGDDVTISSLLGINSEDCATYLSELESIPLKTNEIDSESDEIKDILVNKLLLILMNYGLRSYVFIGLKDNAQKCTIRIKELNLEIIVRDDGDLKKIKFEYSAVKKMYKGIRNKLKQIKLPDSNLLLDETHYEKCVELKISGKGKIIIYFDTKKIRDIFTLLLSKNI
jgi:hypothetical protein